MPQEEYDKILRLPPRTISDLRVLKDNLAEYARDHRDKFMLGYCAAYIFMQTFMTPGNLFMSLLAGALFGPIKSLCWLCLQPLRVRHHASFSLVNWKTSNYLVVCRKVEIFPVRVSPESIQLVAEHATARNKVFMMNLSAPFICEFFRDAQEKALPYVDYVFGNETEAKTFSKVRGWETENVEEIALKISALTKASGTQRRITVITQGSDPVIVAEDGKMKLFPVILLPKEKLVDTDGAEVMLMVEDFSLSWCRR